jgi:hypothetical protein
MKKIELKRNYVENVLGAKFEFISRRLNKSELQVVRENMDTTKTWIPQEDKNDRT